MKKNKYNSKIREFVKQNITPIEDDRKFIAIIYDSFKTILNHSCVQIGSYPRFTAIRPLHDLDILYILGNWDEQNHNPLEALKNLNIKINNEYKNPTNYKLRVSLQSHSITVAYYDNMNEVFSVDIVPAYIFSKNEFNDDTYKVPELIRKKHGKTRTEYYEKILKEQKEMDWLCSDPKGYIEIAKKINQSNEDFRKTVKFVKAWKNACKGKDDNFKLKSFHIEQVMTKYFQDNIRSEIFDVIFKFFTRLPQLIQSAQIKDRANNNNYIDAYVNELTQGQKERIIEARDSFLIKLEGFLENDNVENLLSAGFYRRVSHCEQFLFDFQIPTLLDDNYNFEIFGEVQEREGGFRKYILDKIGLIAIDRKIKFRIKGTQPNVDFFKWKVRNDNSSKEPRGEITDHQTKNDPEITKYNGNHYVECFAILNGICVAKASQNVKLRT